MDDEQITAYKNLAAAVLITAITDLKSKRERNQTLRFLTSNEAEHAKTRHIWLSWLGLTDDGFQKLLRAKSFQGHASRLIVSSNAEVSDDGPVASDCNRDAIPPFAAPSC